MPWYDWITDALGLRGEPVLPALLRIRDACGKPVDQVRLSGTFTPGGQRLSKSLVTASGLCMIEWPARAEALSVRLGDGDAAAEIEIRSRRPDPERVIEVRLSR